jgi:diguanylate cyclase (GGDEF)-like protein/PAS domain S-box-containing protein
VQLLALDQQLDYFFFTAGVVCLALGAICTALRRERIHGLPWGWLNLFAMTQAVVLWLEMAATSVQCMTSPVWAILHSGMAIISFACLVEFGRLSWAATGRKSPGRWIHLVLVGLALGGLAWGTAGLNASTRYALCLTGGLWSAFALFAAASPLPRRCSLRLAALALGLYGLSAGLLPPAAPFVPASLVNQEVFLRLTHVPAAFVWAALIALAGGAAWYGRRCTQSRAGSGARRDTDALVLAGTLLCVLAAGWLFVEQVGRGTDRNLRRQLASEASIAAAAVNPSAVKTLTCTPADTANPDFQRLREQLTWMHAADQRFQRVRLILRHGGAFVLAVGDTLTREFRHLDPGRPVYEPPPELGQVFATARAAVVGPVSDEWGTSVAAFAPVCGAPGGPTVAVVAIDLDATFLLHRVARSRHMPIGGVLVLVFMCVGLFMGRLNLWELTARIAENRRSMVQAQRIAHVGSWAYELPNGPVSWSEELYRIFGCAVGDPVPSFEEHRRFIHPDDWPTLDAAVRSAAATGTSYSLDMRLVRSDGSLRLVAARGEPVRDTFGKVLRLVGTLQDITELREAELAYKKLHTAVEQSSAAIVITDRQANIEYVNPAFTDITGYTPGEVRGRNARILKSGTTPPAAYRELWDALNAGRDWHGRFCNKRRNGQIYWESAAISPILDAGGVITHFVAVKEDITERIATESALRESEEKYRQVFHHVPLGIVHFDRTGRVTDCNDAMLAILGASRQKLIGLDMLKLPNAGVAAAVAVAIEGRLGHFEGEYQSVLSGNLVFLRTDFAPIIVGDGTAAGGVGIVEDISERRKAEQMLRDLAITDELTGLYNRRGFMVLAAQAIRTADRSKRRFTLIYGDMDGMKAINDRFGHKEGDRALLDVSTILKSGLRASDIVARLGGDEFIALALETVEPGDDIIVARLRGKVVQHNAKGDRPYTLSVSFGTTCYDPVEPCTLDELIQRGDKLM